MERPPVIPVEKKARIVMSVIASEVSVAEVARREKVSEQSVGRWKADFLEAGKTALAAGKSGPSTREEQREAEVADLTTALGEAAVEIRVWKKSAKTRAGGRAKGPWPRPARTAAAELARSHALAHSAWGHRKIWAMVRHDGHVVSEATVLRLLRNESLILPAAYQRERRKLAERRKAAFATDPSGPNQVWQLGFSEFETTTGATWRLAGCRDYRSKYAHPFHVSPTANQHDAIDAIMLAKHAEDYRPEYNTIRPHDAIAWNRPEEVHLGHADPTTPTFQTRKSSAKYLTRDMTSQCLGRCIADLDVLNIELDAWTRATNTDERQVDWRFTTTNARIKLRHLYPAL